VLLIAGAMSAAATRPTHQPAPDTARSGCFAYSVRTDRSSYQRATPVKLTVTATNVTNQPCRGHSACGITPGFEVFDVDGRPVYVQNAFGVQCVADPPPPAIIRPGRAETWVDGSWDQHGAWTGRCVPGDCHPARPQEPPGRYRITWQWLDTLRVSTEWFLLS
jgi:hypothetical protein